ncbi:hypothetical protein QC763_403858 [Podospora pseudopauciseta]|uniref:Uncharacterized protein n=1 Tax=Podospora pseudopauciseta TaxID=2093780 RepID=A0ABR0HC82_9PEZI|nr:hypothetical protein QC763_403858 [Podospora pseudopauciseta]
MWIAMQSARKYSSGQVIVATTAVDVAHASEQLSLLLRSCPALPAETGLQQHNNNNRAKYQQRTIPRLFTQHLHTTQTILDIFAKMRVNISSIPRSTILIEVLAEEDRSLFDKLDLTGMIRDNSKSDALSFHIKAFFDQLPLFPDDSTPSPPKPSPKKVAFSCDSPHYKSPTPSKLRKKNKLFGIPTVPTVKTHKQYTCPEATNPLSIIWPDNNNPLPTDSRQPTCHPHIRLSCTDPSPWITPDENPPTPCHHTSWYAATSTLSQHASKLLSLAFTKQNITTLSAPMANLAEAKTLELNILPKLHLAYSLYTAHVFITGRFKKFVIHICRHCTRSLTLANIQILEHKKPWTLLEHWLEKIKVVYDALNTMHLWLFVAAKKLDKAVKYLAEAGNVRMKGGDGMTRGEMLPLYRCMIEVRGWIRREAIQGVMEDKARVKEVVGRLMGVLHPLTGLGYDKAVVEALGGLWKVEQEEKEGDEKGEEGSDEEMADGREFEDLDDGADQDEANSDEEMKDDETDIGEDEIADEGIEVSMSNSVEDDLGELNGDLDDDFDKEMEEQKFVIRKAILEAAVEVRSVCETWRNHAAFIQAIERGQLNDHQD